MSSREVSEWMAFYTIENEPERPSQEAMAEKFKAWAATQGKR